MCIENINANILCYRKRDYYSDKDLIENLEYKTIQYRLLSFIFIFINKYSTLLEFRAKIL